MMTQLFAILALVSIPFAMVGAWLATRGLTFPIRNDTGRLLLRGGARLVLSVAAAVLAFMFFSILAISSYSGPLP